MKTITPNLPQNKSWHAQNMDGFSSLFSGPKAQRISRLQLDRNIIHLYQSLFARRVWCWNGCSLSLGVPSAAYSWLCDRQFFCLLIGKLFLLSFLPVTEIASPNPERRNLSTWIGKPYLVSGFLLTSIPFSSSFPFLLFQRVEWSCQGRRAERPFTAQRNELNSRRKGMVTNLQV